MSGLTTVGSWAPISREHPDPAGDDRGGSVAPCNGRSRRSIRAERRVLHLSRQPAPLCARAASARSRVCRIDWRLPACLSQSFGSGRAYTMALGHFGEADRVFESATTRDHLGREMLEKTARRTRSRLVRRSKRDRPASRRHWLQIRGSMTRILKSGFGASFDWTTIFGSAAGDTGITTMPQTTRGRCSGLAVRRRREFELARPAGFRCRRDEEFR